MTPTQKWRSEVLAVLEAAHVTVYALWREMLREDLSLTYPRIRRALKDGKVDMDLATWIYNTAVKIREKGQASAESRGTEV